MPKFNPEYTYEVQRTPNTEPRAGHYQVKKYVYGGVLKEEYNLTVRTKKDGTEELWCSCMGFRRQKYPHRLHKHILLVKAYQEKGEPYLARFTLDPTNKPVLMSTRTIKA